MQKKLIALAVAGLAAAPVFAQSNVTIYGLMDYGFVTRSGEDGGVGKTVNGAPATGSPRINGTRNELASGVAAGSRIGFRGSEDLGNGLKAIFEVEYGITIDNANGLAASGTNPFWNRHSYLGLASPWGTFLGGRVDGDRYNVINKYDVFGGGTVGNAVTIFNEQVTRGDNAIVWISPDWSGFNVVLGYTTSLIGNENTGQTGTPCGGSMSSTPQFDAAGNFIGNRAAITGASATPDQNCGNIELWLAQFNYNNGPLALTLNYESAKRKDIGNSDIKIGQFGGSYDFGMIKVSALYDYLKDDAGGSAAYSTLATNPAIPSVLTPYTAQERNDVRNWLIGASMPFGGGAHLVRAQYAQHQDKTYDNSDCRKWSVGYKYNLSKRTFLYTDYAQISNDDNAICQIGYSGVNGAADFPQAAGNSLYGKHGFDLGLNHVF